MSASTGLLQDPIPWATVIGPEMDTCPSRANQNFSLGFFSTKVERGFLGYFSPRTLELELSHGGRDKQR